VEYGKVVTFRASSIGDALMGKYLLENIHERFPQAKIGMVVGSRAEMLKDLFAAYPWLEIMQSNRRNPASLLRLWSTWKGADLVVTQYAGKKGGSFNAWSKIAARLLSKRGGLVGYADGSPALNALLYDRVVPLPGGRAPVALERDALAAAGVTTNTSPSQRYVPQAGLIERLGLMPGQYVVLHLFSGGDARGFSPERRRKIIKHLTAALPNTTLVLTGSPKEQESLGEGLERVLRPRTTLQEVMHLIDHSRGVIAVDTGVAHLAAHLRKPLMVLASCVGLHWWGEEMYGRDIPARLFAKPEICAGMHDFSGYAKCLEALDLDEVASAAVRLLS
jgi:ADP-heptose:LPS heptosyltransferase